MNEHLKRIMEQIAVLKKYEQQYKELFNKQNLNNSKIANMQSVILEQVLSDENLTTENKEEIHKKMKDAVEQKEDIEVVQKLIEDIFEKTKEKILFQIQNDFSEEEQELIFKEHKDFLNPPIEIEKEPVKENEVTSKNDFYKNLDNIIIEVEKMIITLESSIKVIETILNEMEVEINSLKNDQSKEKNLTNKEEVELDANEEKKEKEVKKENEIEIEKENEIEIEKENMFEEKNIKLEDINQSEIDADLLDYLVEEDTSNYFNINKNERKGDDRSVQVEI